MPYHITKHLCHVDPLPSITCQTFAENHPEAKLLQKSYNLLLALNQAKHNKNWVYFDSILKGNNLPVNTYRNACRIKNQAEETTEQR